MAIEHVSDNESDSVSDNESSNDFQPVPQDDVAKNRIKNILTEIYEDKPKKSPLEEIYEDSPKDMPKDIHIETVNDDQIYTEFNAAFNEHIPGGSQIQTQSTIPPKPSSKNIRFVPPTCGFIKGNPLDEFQLSIFKYIISNYQQLPDGDDKRGIPLMTLDPTVVKKHTISPKQDIIGIINSHPVSVITACPAYFKLKGMYEAYSMNTIMRDFIDRNLYFDTMYRARIREYIYINYCSKYMSAYTKYIDEAEIENQKRFNDCRTITGYIAAPQVTSIIDAYSKYELCGSIIGNNIKYEQYDHIIKNTSNKYLFPHKQHAIKECEKHTPLPASLMRMFTDHARYFTQIHSKLVYDPTTGYYSYKHEGVLIPVVCKHVYMTYTYCSDVDISIECYDNGVCRYCGQDLVDHTKQLRDTLPTFVYDIIFRLIGIINLELDNDAIMHDIFNVLYDAYMSTKSIYPDSSIFAVMFTYSLYKKIINDKRIPISSKHIIFEDHVRKVITPKGITLANIEILIEDDVFKNINMSRIYGYIKDNGTTNLKYSLLTTPLSVTFGTITDIHEINFDKLIAKTFAQKILIKGFEHARIEWTHFYALAMNRWTYNSYVLPKMVTMNNDTLMTLINNTDMNTYLQFFQKCCIVYCPAADHRMHDIMSHDCAVCGMKMDCSNWKSVYEKYVTNIANGFIDTIHILSDNKYTNDVRMQESDIVMAKDNIGTKFITDENINKYIDNTLIDMLNDNKYNAQILHLICIKCGFIYNQLSYIKRNEVETPICGQFVRKALSYMVQKRLITIRNLIYELYIILCKSPSWNVLKVISISK